MTSVEITITSILDFFPILRTKSFYKTLAITVICIVQFIASINFTLQSGTYWIGNFLLKYLFKKKRYSNYFFSKNLLIIMQVIGQFFLLEP